MESTGKFRKGIGAWHRMKNFLGISGLVLGWFVMAVGWVVYVGITKLMDRFK